ncbi:MAG: DUF4097 domain-containing protein [Pseudobutyrivibrio sp.]|nr:DUF4097 domain-containing protein [Pseudobutyrivibrio sp.]
METKNFKKKYLLVIWIATFIVIITALLTHMFNFFEFGLKMDNFEYDFSGESIEDIKVELDAADIDIEYGDHTLVTYYGAAKYEPEVSCSDGKLSIISKNHIRNINHMNDYKIRIMIPTGTTLDSLVVAVDAGDIDIVDVKGDEMTVDTDAGDYRVTDVAFTKGSLTADAGDIKISDSVFDSMKVDADLGNIDIKNVKADAVQLNVEAGDVNADGDFKKLEATCELGAIDITVPDPDQVDLDLDCELGSIEVNGKDW